jgi:hypothetical protein
MEKTEFREAFFAEAKTDPYTHMVTHHVASAWADGYEQALRDHGLDEARQQQTHNERFEMALEWLTDAKRKSQAQAIMALATLAPLGPGPGCRFESRSDPSGSANYVAWCSVHQCVHTGPVSHG